MRLKIHFGYIYTSQFLLIDVFVDARHSKLKLNIVFT